MSTYQPTILIVDDNAEHLRMLSDYFIDHPGRIIMAQNGQSALDKAVYSRPDLILLDIILPDMDGFHVCRQLKSDPLTQHIPIIFITAEANTPDQTLQGFAAGGADFLNQSVQQQELVARVNVHLCMHKQLQELRKSVTMLNQQGVGQLPKEASDAYFHDPKIQDVPSYVTHNHWSAYQQLAELQSKIQHEREVFQSIFDHLAMGFILLDIHNHVLIHNRAFTELSEVPIINKSYIQQLRKSLLDFVVDTARQTGETIYQQYEIHPSKQTPYILNVTATPIPDGDGGTLVLVSITNESKMVLQQLSLWPNEQNKQLILQARLVIETVHAINSSLQLIRNAVYILSSIDENQCPSFLNLINDEIDQISILIQQNLSPLIGSVQ